MIDGKQVKNRANPTGTGKFLNESGQYETAPGGGGGYIFTNTTGLTSTGTNQATALLLSSKINTINSVPAGTGVRLPSAVISDFMTIVNHGVNELLIYPASGESVEGGAANIPFVLFEGQTYRIGCNTTGFWEGVDLNIYDDESRVLVLPTIIVEPGLPTSNSGFLYGKYISGKFTAKIKGAAGLDTPLQNAFWQNNIIIWNPTTATAGVWLGTAGAGAGTYSTALPTITSIYTSIKRARYANVVTTLNQVLGQRNIEAMFFRGSVAGQGGFFFYARFGFDVWTNGSRFFGGMHSATTVVSAEPSALNNTVGFCIDSGDNGAISFLTRGTVATKASTGYTAISGKGYDIYIFCSPNSSQYAWRIIDTNARTEVNGVATATLPTNTTMLTAGVLASNAALTPVTSVQLGINRIYVETDN